MEGFGHGFIWAVFTFAALAIIGWTWWATRGRNPDLPTRPPSGRKGKGGGPDHDVTPR